VKVEQAFGQILRHRRKDQNLSQQALAELAEIDRTYVSMLERGIRQPSLQVIIRLAQALRIRPESMVTDTLDLLDDRLNDQ